MEVEVAEALSRASGVPERGAGADIRGDRADIGFAGGIRVVADFFGTEFKHDPTRRAELTRRHKTPFIGNRYVECPAARRIFKNQDSRLPDRRTAIWTAPVVS